MKLTQHTYTHVAEGFNVKVVGAGKKLVKAVNVESGEEVKFNRGKFEWMIGKGVFIKNEELSEA